MGLAFPYLFILNLSLVLPCLFNLSLNLLFPQPQP